MDTSRQLPTHGDGLPDMREPARTLLESMVNEVMDAQADMPCGDGANARNGYRERGPATPVGVIALRIPELRAGTHFPEGVIGRCSRADRAVAAAAAESRANGVPTRKMERIARKMGMERLSRDRVGAMRGSLDAEVGEPASRDPGGIEVPYPFLGAAYVKCRRDGRVRSTALVTAIGVGSDGVRRMLEDAEADAHAYLDFSAEHRRRIRTNNVQERMNREIKRRLRVVQVFPSPESMLRLVGAVCAEQDEDWSSRRYISPVPMLRPAEPAGTEPVESEASHRRGLMIVETTMELAGTGRRAA